MCHTNWSCVVHLLFKYIYNNLNNCKPDNPILMGINGPLTYGEHLSFAKYLANKINLNPSFYTPHCYRKAAITELLLGGYDVGNLQIFAGWKNISFVKTYMNPNNPDLVKFYNIQEYKELRKKQGNGDPRGGVPLDLGGGQMTL